MPDMYSMSDEELAQMDFGQFVADNEEVADEEPAEQTPEEPEEAPEPEADNAESEIDGEEEEQEEVETAEVDETEEPADTTEADVFDNADEGTQEDADEDTDEESEEPTDGMSLEELQSFYDAVTAEFKANGKMMSISNPSDIKTLVQQGINYSKRMAEMKPGMGVLRTLEEHGLMSNEKISYLIDLHNKDPKAIAKLVKDSGIEAYDLESEDTDSYKPVNKVIEQSKFQEVVAELRSSPKFAGLLQTISGSWDEDSHHFVINNPNVLRVLSEQQENGDFNKILDKVEYERSCGRLKDVSDIQAYSIVEQTLIPSTKPAEPKPVIKAPRPKPKAASNNSKKRKVASPNSGSSAKEEAFNPLAVSDEEIMKMAELHKLY